MITPSDYKNIGGLNLDNTVFPSYYKPFITKKDYVRGYVYRYFVQKINDSLIVEVDQDNYNNISDNYYNKIYFSWIINGPKNNEYKDKILYRKGVQEQNIQSLNDNEKKMKGIKSYLNNPLEFWSGK